MARTRVPIMSTYKKGYTRQIIGQRDTTPPVVGDLKFRIDVTDRQELPFLLEELLNDERLRSIDLRPPRPPCPGLLGMTREAPKKRIRIVIDLTVNSDIIDLTNE